MPVVEVVSGVKDTLTMQLWPRPSVREPELTGHPLGSGAGVSEKLLNALFRSWTRGATVVLPVFVTNTSWSCESPLCSGTNGKSTSAGDTVSSEPLAAVLPAGMNSTAPASNGPLGSASFALCVLKKSYRGVSAQFVDVPPPPPPQETLFCALEPA